MSNKLTFASLNVLGFPFGLIFKPERATLRYKAIARNIDRSDIDVLNLQEIISYVHLSWIKRHLKNFPYCVYEKSYFGPRGGLVTFSKLPVEQVGYKDFTKNFYLFDKSMVEAFITKGMLVVKNEKKKTIFVNTHLATTHDADWSEEGRYFKFMELQIGEFHQFLNELQQKMPEYKIIASGDFNIAKNSILYKKLMKYPHLVDVFEKNESPTYHRQFIKSGDPYCIDYIFTLARKKLSILQTKYMFKNKVILTQNKRDFASDHIGLQIISQIQEG